MVISWEPTRRANTYKVQASKDGQTWETLYTFNRTASSPFTREAGTGRREAGADRQRIVSSPLFKDYLHLPEGDARYIRIILTSPESTSCNGIRDISVKPLVSPASSYDLYFDLTCVMPHCSYTLYLSNDQSYWTVLGVD